MMDKFQVKYWFQFNDNEIGNFQYYFIDYMKENKHFFDTDENVYNFAIFSTNIQYQMRLLKDVVYNGNKKDFDFVRKFIIFLNLYPNLCIFIRDKMVDGFDECEAIANFMYIEQNIVSYFKMSEDEITADIKDSEKKLKKLFNKFI